MKTIKTLFFTALFFCTLSHSQITKGNFLVGGNGGYFKTTIKNDLGSTNTSTNILALNPNIGYFIVDKVVGGLKIETIFDFENPKSNDYYSKVSPFLRYYLLKSENRVNIFAEARYFTPFLKGQLSINNTRGFGLTGGPVFFFNSSVALELGFDYSKSNVSSEFTSVKEISTFNVLIGFQIHLKK